MKNLSLLPPKEKNEIELDKQAAFFVWKVKNAKAGPDLWKTEENKLEDEAERFFFQQSIEKYKSKMGVA
ncbi:MULTISPECIES: DUF3283 family protein [unclassified Aliivibrio]|jgi:hypothetical protein|uniref:DUF3283 family protein n=1 Tax=unclassified Aliivibrio TaxID=2645654 RepID=UPI00080E32FC|nr:MULTISPECIES: DUF3283 family protein [unclassified Aliivibrio]OCH16766.1 pyridoxamine 5-phosphate oxidase [Aliivibrio sp. 1S165]OCH19186.1 pyridoxamine 5-phosphate oxidase [Aliivibrio sp. 1S128]OCH32782.1 pyridoxamine 5-phosphate oxidase [Aliivibrio sp. 1S175]